VWIGLHQEKEKNLNMETKINLDKIMMIIVMSLDLKVKRRIDLEVKIGRDRIGVLVRMMITKWTNGRIIWRVSRKEVYFE